VFTGHESYNISWLAVDGLNLYQPMLELPSYHQLKSVHVCKIWTSTGKQCSGGVAIMYVSLHLSLKKRIKLVSTMLGLFNIMRQ
jgi:hypothetical protein